MSDVPAGWQERPLGDVVDILDSRRIPVNASERALRPGVVPYFGATGQVGWIDEAIFDEPLVLLGEDGVQFFDRDKQKAYGITGPAWVNNHAHVLRARDEVVDRRYLIHFLNWVDYADLANGTTRLKLTQTAMRKIPVRLPPRLKQRHIVDLLEDHLSRLEAAQTSIAANRRRLDRLRLSAASQSLSGEMPWPRMPLADLLEATIGGLWGSSPGEEECNVRVLRVTEMRRDGTLDPSTAALRSVPERYLASRRLRTGDLLLEKSGGGPNTPVGRVGLVPVLSEVSVCSNFMQLMRPKRDRVDPRFLHLYLQTFYLRGGTEPMQKATTNIRNLKASEYVRIEVPVPDLDTQAKLIDSVDSVASSCARLENAAATASRRGTVLRRAVLDAAFSGRLTGQGVDAEIIEELAEVAS